MKHFQFIYLALILVVYSCANENKEEMPKKESVRKVAIAIHGGAGNLKKLALTPEEESQYKSVLDSALEVGHAILLQGGTSVDAVEASIRVMEDCPLFNAGKGAVFAHNGVNELDAAIMNGGNLECGAVTGVRHVKNPISASRVVMEKSEFVLLSGVGAEEFAQEQGIEMVDSSYFYTPHRWEQLLEAKKEDKVELDHNGKKTSSLFDKLSKEEKFGTVGCVALDLQGNIAAGTSTGGLTNKRYGRIGDSPIIGAGTYANNHTCAVSCTGKGEDFIRLNIAHDISSAMEFGQLSLDSAVTQAIQTKLKSVKGRGGCIAIDKNGNIAMSFTTTGMFRGSIDTASKKMIGIYESE